MKKNLLMLVLTLGLFFVASQALAEETTAVNETAITAETTASATEPAVETESAAVTQDETVTASDLGIAEPTLLPDSRFYFFKNWGRAVRETLTFNKEKRAELSARFADEKLLEAQKLAAKTFDPAVLSKTIENYQKEVEKTKSLSDQVSKDDPNAGKFLDKLADSQLKHQRLMDRLAKQLPPEAKEKVLVAQGKALERFGEIMTQLDNPEKMKERLEKAMDAQKGGEFKNFKNLEVLMRIEAKAPEQAKEALRGAQENALNRLHGDLGQMSPEDQTKFKDYLSGVSGDELRRAEIIDRLENKGLPEGIRAEMNQSRAEIADRFEKKVENMSKEDRAKFTEQMKSGELPRPRMMDKLEGKIAPSGVVLPPRQTQQSSFGERAKPILPPQPGTGVKTLPRQVTPGIKPPLPGRTAPNLPVKPPLPNQTAPAPIR